MTRYSGSSDSDRAAEAAYWAAEDARHEAADAMIAAGLASIELWGDEEDGEPDVD